MDDFNRKVEDASARVSKTVAEAAERIEKRSRIYQVSERRGRARSTPALDQSAARGLREAFGIRRLHGETPASSEVAFLDTTKHHRARRRLARFVPRAVILIPLLTTLLIYLPAVVIPSRRARLSRLLPRRHLGPLQPSRSIRLVRGRGEE